MNASSNDSQETDSEKNELQALRKMILANRQTIHRLRERVAVLETALELTSGDAQMQWLFRNRSERMDATVPMFNPLRAEFHMARYRFASQFVADKTVADIASGTGYGARLLHQEGRAARVVGIDVSEEAVDYARGRHALPGIEFVVADGAQTGLAEVQFDAVVSFETIEHVADDKQLVAEFARILKPEGMLICSTPNAWPLDMAPHHVREYGRSGFEQVLTTYFDIVTMYNQNSGSDFRFNHDQPAGIVETTAENEALAECYIAVCRKR